MNHELMLLLIYVLFAISLSFLCSIAESTLLSITPTYAEQLKITHPERAALIKHVRQSNIEQSLAAILTLNTFANTIGAILSGAKATAVFGNAWFGVFSAVMTVLILFCSEIIPKSIGAIYWAKIAYPVALFVKFIIFILYPVVLLTGKITKLIAGDKSINAFTRDEFSAMARMGVQDGELSEHESLLINNLLRFESMRVNDVMTPRSVMTCFNEKLSIADAFNLLDKHSFSRLPVYKDDPHNITGFVLRNDILLKEAKSQSNITLLDIRRPILMVTKTTLLWKVLNKFLENHQHIAIVIDEYGDSCALITLEDLVETLFGREIVDEKDKEVDMRSLAKRKWLASKLR